MQSEIDIQVDEIFQKMGYGNLQEDWGILDHIKFGMTGLTLLCCNELLCALRDTNSYTSIKRISDSQWMITAPRHSGKSTISKDVYKKRRFQNESAKISIIFEKNLRENWIEDAERYRDGTIIIDEPFVNLAFREGFMPSGECYRIIHGKQQIFVLTPTMPQDAAGELLLRLQ